MAYIEEMLKKVNKAIELLREQGVSYYFIELLEIQTALIQELEKKEYKKPEIKRKSGSS